ncbi:MAG: hypothetical protein AB7W16_23525 [Candidatus Obscuribacterales bacterium]
MELLICQSCGVVLRTKGKHCTGCGVTLALHAPTSIPSFAEARPPLSVSVKQDHLLLERVVTQRQLLTLGPRPAQSGGHYGVSSGSSFPSSITSPVADYGGNGHGNGKNGGNGGNGNGHGNAGKVVEQTGAGGIMADPAEQAPPSSPPAYAEPEAPLPTLKQVDSPDTGLVPVDPFADSSGDRVHQEEQAATAIPENTGSATNSTPEPASTNQEPPASSPSGQVLPGSGLLSSFSSKGLLAAGAAGAAGLAAAQLKGKAPLGSLADWVGTSRDEKTSSSGSANQAAETPAPEIPAAEPAGSSVSAQESAPDSPSTQNAGGPVPGTYFQSFRNPGFSSSAVSIAIGAPVGPISVPSASPLPKESAPVSSDSSASGAPGPPAAPEPQGTPDLASQMAAALSAGPAEFEPEPAIPAAVEKAANVMTSEAISPIAEGRPESPERSAGIGDSLSGNTTEARGSFDFVSQVGPGFNPEEFFTTGSNQAVAPPEDPGAVSVPAAAEKSPAPASGPAPAPAPDSEPAPASPRQDLVDFFGEDKSGIPIASASMSPANDTHTAGSSGDDSFDFFSGSPVRNTEMQAESMPESPPIEATAVREKPARMRVADEPPVSEDEEKDERPKVAMPKGVTARPSAIVEEDEEDVEEEDHETGGPRPKRRSFSGNSIKPQTVKSKNDEDDQEDDDETGGATGVIDWMEGDVNLAGQNVTRKTALVLVAVGVFILVQIPGWCITFFSALTGGGGQPQQAQQMPNQGMQQQQQYAQAPQQQGPQSALSFGKRLPGLGGQPGPMPGQPGAGQPGPQNASLDPSGFPVVGGRWQVVTFSGKQPFQSQMVINQTGAQFGGQGQDGLGMFEIAGILQPPDRIDFKKVYDKEAKRKGAITEPMIYSARLEQQGNSNLFMASGGWKSHKREGFENSIYNPARMVPISGRFQAKQLVAQTTTVASNNPLPVPGIPNLPKLAGPNIGNPLAGLSPGHGQTKIQATQSLFLNIALCCIGAGAAIFLFFLMLFGPAGKMNVWEKEKYIPSQFKPQHMKMVRELGKRVTPGAVPFGKRLEWHWWWPFTPTQLNLPAEVRTQNPHILLIGSGDKGKTRLIAGMVTHDIKSKDRAVVVIDSDGQLSDLIIEWIASQPEGREFAKRVMLVDPTYKAGSVAYNPLEMPEDGDLQAASSAIVHGFKAIYTEPPGAQSQWNAQTANILRNAALLLMVNGRTLTDLPNLLQDNDFRDIMLESVERRKNEKTEYITILETWNQYKKLARTDQWINWVEPILNRVGPMLSDGRIRPILTKPVSDLKLRDIIAEKKILIVKVPQGELDQNANLLGSLIVTGLQQAAMSFCKGRRETEERPVALYIDEMDNFIEKETIENLTSETKRYQVGFVGCLKTLQHLPEDYRSQLIINMGTLCVFALAKKDGDMLGPQMFRVDGRKIKHQTIQNFFNKVNTSPQFELIMDEEKLNIDRIVGQEEQTFFCYRVGTVAGTFRLKAHDFKDIPERKIDRKLVEKMHAISDGSEDSGKKKKKKSDRDVA